MLDYRSVSPIKNAVACCTYLYTLFLSGHVQTLSANGVVLSRQGVLNESKIQQPCSEKWIKTSKIKQAQHNLFTFLGLPLLMRVFVGEETKQHQPLNGPLPLHSQYTATCRLLGASKTRDVHGRRPRWSRRSWCPSSCRPGDWEVPEVLKATQNIMGT